MSKHMFEPTDKWRDEMASTDLDELRTFPRAPFREQAMAEFPERRPLDVSVIGISASPTARPYPHNGRAVGDAEMFPSGRPLDVCLDMCLEMRSGMCLDVCLDAFTDTEQRSLDMPVRHAC